MGDITQIATLISEFHWEIPIDKIENLTFSAEDSDPLNHCFRLVYKPLLRPKISDQFSLNKLLIQKGTYHWPFAIKLYAFPPTWRFSYDTYRGNISYNCSAMTYGIPTNNKFVNAFTSNRLAESEQIPITFGFNDVQHKLNLGKIITEDPHVTYTTQFKDLSENIMTRWDFRTELKPYNFFGETIEIDGEFFLADPTSVKSKTISLDVCVVMDVSFSPLPPTEIKFRKMKYKDIIPAGKSSFQFKLSVFLDPGIAELFDGHSPNVWPSFEYGIENIYRIVISQNTYVTSQEEVSTIVNIPLGVILPEISRTAEV